MDASQGREVLPKNVKPKHYHVQLEPHFDTYKYTGSVDIECVWSPARGLESHLSSNG